jgi:heat shock protein HslJ
MTARRLLASLAIALFVASCSSGAATDGSEDGYGGELQATRWVLRSYAADAALAVVPPTVYVDADFRAQRLKGFSGCNDYDAVYRSGGRLLLISMPVILRKTCGSVELDAFEAGYLDLLQKSRFYGIRNDALTIRGADLKVLLVFDAAPANPLLGSWLVESYANASGAATAPLEGTELTAIFRIKQVSGSSGCNSFQGPYTTTGSVVAIGPLATTQMACAENVMTQESAFLAALGGVGRVEPRGERLDLTNARGDVLVKLVRPFAVEPSPGPSASPSASVQPSASPSAPPSASPSAAPSATPTVAPTATPSAAPTATATAAPSGTPAPTIIPPASVPPTASCALNAVVNGVSTQVATIVYPADWNTVAAPPALACRYFDPEPITVPADPATLTTAVMVKVDLTSTYDAALTAATNPVAWNVLIQQPVTVAGLPATRLEATSTAGSPGYPVGTTRYGYLVNAGGRPVWFETSGTIGDATFTTDMSVVDLMASKSTLIVVAVPA